MIIFLKVKFLFFEIVRVLVIGFFIVLAAGVREDFFVI